MKNTSNSNGITLTALVMTIVIMLILVAVTIGSINGGLFNYAGQAKKETAKSEEIETIQTAFFKAKGANKAGRVTETYLENELSQYNATVTKNGNNFKVNINEERDYLINSNGEVRLKNSNEFDSYDLSSNANIYYGYEVINYAETLPEELQNTEWQLFYSGKIDENDAAEEEHIYLISSGCIQNSLLPTVTRNGVKLTRETVNSNNEPITVDIKPINVSGSNYQAYFSAYNKSTGIKPGYSSIINNIKNSEIRKLNKQYFTYLINNNISGNGYDAIATAYMLDTETWEDFAGTNADYAIGGPTAELFTKSFNKYKNQVDLYQTNVNTINGYIFSKNSGESFAKGIDIIENDTDQRDNPYSISNRTDYSGSYWLASPRK